MSYVISVKMVELDTNEEVLYRMRGSKCHFKKWFTHQNHGIQLRLDRDDIANGEPVLDADIKDKNTG